MSFQNRLRLPFYLAPLLVAPQAYAIDLSPSAQPCLPAAISAAKPLIVSRPPIPAVMQMTEWQPQPSPQAIYGRPSHWNSTPLNTPLDDFFSGANCRPTNLDNWFGNGYSF
jgi:hypothetical protein